MNINKKVVIFKNADKDPWLNKIDRNDPYLGKIRPSERICIVGPPHAGKSNICKNLIINSEPYDLIYLYQIDTESKEYDILNTIPIFNMGDMPIMDEEMKTKKILLIFEDISVEGSFSKKDLNILDEFLKYHCSHNGMSLIFLTQDLFQIPTKLRRKISVFYIINCEDIMLRFLPMSKNDKLAIKAYLKKKGNCFHDSICIDTGHKLKYRYNLFTPIEID